MRIWIAQNQYKNLFCVKLQYWIFISLLLSYCWQCQPRSQRSYDLNRHTLWVTEGWGCSIEKKTERKRPQTKCRNKNDGLNVLYLPFEIRIHRKFYKQPYSSREKICNRTARNFVASPAFGKLFGKYINQYYGHDFGESLATVLLDEEIATSFVHNVHVQDCCSLFNKRCAGRKELTSDKQAWNACLCVAMIDIEGGEKRLQIEVEKYRYQLNKRSSTHAKSIFLSL